MLLNGSVGDEIINISTSCSVEKSNKEENKMKNFFRGYYRRMFMVALSAHIIAPSSTLAAKVVFNGVRWLRCGGDGSIMLGDAATELYYYQVVLSYIGMCTPRQFVNIFPIAKRYDGSKHNTQDYYSTMQVLEGYGMDRQLGKNASHLLWDYANTDTRSFLVGYWNVLDELQRMDSEKMNF